MDSGKGRCGRLVDFVKRPGDHVGMPDDTVQLPLDRRVAAVRAFNRFYTRRIGVVGQTYLHSRFSLTEVRVLYELAYNDALTATQIGTALDLDAGYLSRMLRRFEQDSLLARGPSETDKRQNILALTPAGRAAFAPLDERSRQEIGAMLAALPEPAQEAVVGGMHAISRLLAEQPATDWFIRGPAPGDIGWVIERHGALYAEEYNFNQQFEALVAQVATASVWGRCSWCAKRMTSASCGCCWWSRRRAVWASARVWSRRASRSLARLAIAACGCGRTTFSWRRAAFIARPDFG
jgi:DNA-binding MarR family transcriptional regulator